MSIPSADAFVARWAAGVQGASQKYRDGINAYAGNPMELARAQLGKAQAAYSAAASAGGKMDRGLANATAAHWKAQSTGPGAQNYTNGANKGRVKMMAKAQQLVAAQAQAKAAAAAAVGPRAKWEAAVHAMQAAFGKPLM